MQRAQRSFIACGTSSSCLSIGAMGLIRLLGEDKHISRRKDDQERAQPNRVFESRKAQLSPHPKACGILAETSSYLPGPEDPAACSSVAMSSFFICSMACMAAGWRMYRGRLAGMTCQEMP
jgi:hypothetical protein